MPALYDPGGIRGSFRIQHQLHCAIGNKDAAFQRGQPAPISSSSTAIQKRYKRHCGRLNSCPNRNPLSQM